MNPDKLEKSSGRDGKNAPNEERGKVKYSGVSIGQRFYLNWSLTLKTKSCICIEIH